MATFAIGHIHGNLLALNDLIIGRTIGIDTIARGVLTAIRLPDRRLLQNARYEMPSVDV